MNLTLKPFQEDALADLIRSFRVAQRSALDWPQAMILSAPTGSGKTVMATAFIEALLNGTEDQPSDLEYTFLWVTDQPELNLQTRDKMLAVSSALPPSRLVVIDTSLPDRDRLVQGRVYFLNTQKLSVTSTLTRPGNDRTWTLWEILTRTLRADPRHFLVVIDEAHRGMQGAQADEAASIVQKFLKGSPEIPSVPLVIGISATPERFRVLLENTRRAHSFVHVDPQDVRDSGLIKESVDIYHPKGAEAADVTLLTQAIRDWQRFTEAWARYTAAQGIDAVRPILLVQVEDGTRDTVSRTDLGLVVSTLYNEIAPAPGTGWIGHAFQEGVDLDLAGHNVRYIAPSRIEADPEVQVVLFKTSLNTGWDCPRAETLVSFRRARDETHIAQLVGRMVRAPLARRIDADETLNAVALYLPYYDQEAVGRARRRLVSDPETVPPADIRDGDTRVELRRRAGCEEVFQLLASLPTYVVPRSHAQSPVVRIARLARLLADTGLESEPVQTYRTGLIGVLHEEAECRRNEPAFQRAIEAAGSVEMGHVRVRLGYEDEPDTSESMRVGVAGRNLDERFEDVGRLLGEGLHREYLRHLRDTWRGQPDEFPMRQAKIETCALVGQTGVLDHVQDAARRQIDDWLRLHGASLARLGERERQLLQQIQSAAEDPHESILEVPESLDWHRGTTAWDRHLFVGAEGMFHEDFAQSSWEPRVLREELDDPSVVAWLRMVGRKPWSLCVPYQVGTDWHGAYPDFLIFRQTPGGLVAEIVDPHLLGEPYAAERAVGMARYAERHWEKFRRIELVVVDRDTPRRLDLKDSAVRRRVATVSNQEQLRLLFEGA